MSQAARARQDQIMAELLDRKHVTVKGLAVTMEVSEATVRRDLKALADTRQLTLVHGGATLPRRADYSFRAKQLRHVDAKRFIAALAAERIGDGEQVFLDSGTTCLEMVAPLRQKQGLSVLTNSVRLAHELDAEHMEVIVLGGSFRPTRLDMVGPMTTEQLSQIHGYVAFVGADGLSMDTGPSASDMDSAHINRLAVLNARETVLLVDHSKFENPALFRIVGWDSITQVVTDQPAPDAWMRFFEAGGIDVIWPAMDSGDAARSPAASTSPES